MSATGVERHHTLGSVPRGTDNRLDYADPPGTPSQPGGSTRHGTLASLVTGCGLSGSDRMFPVSSERTYSV